MKHIYSIHGMTCDGCRKNVQEILSKVESVSNASLDLKNAKVASKWKSKHH